MLNDDKIVNLPDNDDVPGTYYRLAMDYDMPAFRSQAAHRLVEAPQRVALHPHVPVSPQSPRLEDLRRTARRLE
ncbi:MAG: hypothetical protein U0792_16595 [Gemmataceae bacterium]